ncbi:rho guanidine dissociation inhibitor [Peziza echinospora]|nr:rho guanidine dissociation inhibitor [Peziza echinospora]
MATPAHHDDELVPSTTEGYKVGDKKTVDEYANLDAGDEALNRWKASLGIGPGAASKAIGDPNDPRKVVILHLALQVPGRPDVIIDLSKEGAVEALNQKPFTIKEGAEYRMKVKFRVQHEVISGLRYLQLVKRKGITVDKSDEMMGSYGPNTESQPVYEKTFASEEAPSGMLARGSYNVLSRFMDDDKVLYLEFKWSFDIKKTWE